MNAELVSSRMPIEWTSFVDRNGTSPVIVAQDVDIAFGEPRDNPRQMRGSLEGGSDNQW